MQSHRERRAQRVPADEARDQGERIDRRFRLEVEAEIAGARLDRAQNARVVRREGERQRVDAEKDMMHAAVARDRHLVDPVAPGVRGRENVLEQLGDRFHDEALQDRKEGPIRVERGQARHDVRAVRQLAIQGGVARQLFSRVQVHQARRHGRRAYVERKTVGLQARVSLLERDRLPAAHHHRQLHPGRIPELVETAQRGEGRRFFERSRSVRLEVRPGEGLAAQRTQRDIDLAYVGGERDPVEARPEVDLAQGGRRGEDHRVLPHRMHACQAPAFVQLRL